MLKMDSACVLVTVPFRADLLVGPTCHNKIFLHLMIVAPLCVLVCVCLCVCESFSESYSSDLELSLFCTADIPCPRYLSLPQGHFSLNCPCPARLKSHVHCTFPGPQVTSTWTAPVLHNWQLYLSWPSGVQVMSWIAWTVPVLHNWQLMSIVSFPELPLFCMTDNPWLYLSWPPEVQITSWSAWTVPVLHNWQPMSTVSFLASRSLHDQPELSLFCTTDIPCPLYLSLPPGSLQPELSLSCMTDTPISTLPFLASRSLQPELSLSCMTGTPCPL